MNTEREASESMDFQGIMECKFYGNSITTKEKNATKEKTPIPVTSLPPSDAAVPQVKEVAIQ